MPTINQLTLALDEHDGYANVFDNSFNNTASTVYVASLTSTSGDMQPFWYFDFGTTIPRYSVVSAASFQPYFQSQPASNAITVEVHLLKAGAPVAPTTVSGVSGATRTTAKTEVNLAASGPYTVPVRIPISIVDQLNEILQTTAVSSIVILMRDKVRSYANNNRSQFRAYTWDAASRPIMGAVTYEVPPARTGASSRTMAVSRVRSGSFPTSVSGAGSRTMGVSRFMAAQVGAPPAIVGKSGRTMAASRSARGGIGDPTKHTLFAVEPPVEDTHHFVTEDGTVLGFSASYDTTLGDVRDGVIGNADDAWFPESGVRTRTTAPLLIAAALGLRDEPKRDGDVLERRLADVREIHHPDGRVLDVWDVLKKGRPSDERLNLSARPKSAYLREPLSLGVRTAAFDTGGSTPELPVYAIDAAGGIVAPLLARRVDRGSLALGVKLEERGILPLASVGRPIEGDGASDPTSVTLSYQDHHLHVSVRGELTRIREAALGPFGEALAMRLYWTAFRSYLVTRSAWGVRTAEIAAGPPVELSERILTAGVDANGVGLGAFLAPGSSSLGGRTGVPFFSLRAPSRQEAEAGVTSLYRDLARSDRDWTIIPPDYSLVLSRADTKPLELAPGETQTFDFAVKRVGNYTGGIDFSSSATGLTTSYAVLSVTGDTTVYRVTVTAPAGMAEGSAPLRLEAKATGADNPGSVLADVRNSLDTLLEVAASPVISANPTAVLKASDAALYRVTEFLRDTSAFENAFSYNGHARPNRAGIGLLATGTGNAAVYSAVLNNTSQPQRMNAQQSFEMILRQVDKTSISNGVVFQFGSDATTGSAADGGQILRVNGGFTLRTLLNGVSTISPDVLGWTSGDAELGLIVTTTAVMLYNRANMRYIWLPRPAWPDAGVRCCWGAVRTPAGGFTNATRVHLMTAAIHPYALSEIQLRRTLDKLRENAPAESGNLAGKEYPDNCVGIFVWDETTGKYQNRAAPALGVTMTATGAVGTPTGAVSTPGGTTAYIDTGKVFAQAATLTVVTSVASFSDANDYDCNFGVSAAGTNIMAAEVSRRWDGKPRLRHQSGGDAGANAEWNQRDLDKTPATSVMNFALEISSTGAASKLTSLDTWQSITSSGTAANGALGVSIGAIVRSSGGVVEGQKATNREMVICAGVVSQAALQDTRAIMTA